MKTTDQIKCAACFGTGLASHDTAEAHAEQVKDAYERGAFEERLRLVTFIAENQETLSKFSGDGLRVFEFMLREMKPPTDWLEPKEK